MFSVVIPLYNKQKYIKECIQSVLNQSFVQFEIIVVNDGSTDNSLNIVNSFLDSRINVLSIPNSGVSNARNIGIEYSKYSWVAFLDADDSWESNYLESSNNLISLYGISDIISTNYFNYSSHKKIKVLNIDTGFLSSYFINPCIHSSAVIINKAVFKKVGCFNTKLKYGEDQHLWFRIGATFKVFFNASALVYYRLDDHALGNKDFSKRVINTDLISVIDELEINTKEWKSFKERYILRYMRPYYICDNHLEFVTKALKSITPHKNNIILLSFYLLPRFIVKPLYKLFFLIKYTY